MLKHNQPSFMNVQSNPQIENLRSLFYNTLANSALDDASITPNNFDQKLNGHIQKMILDIVNLSSPETNIIKFPLGQTLTRNNCPETYLKFFDGVMKLSRNDGNKLPIQKQQEIALLAQGLMHAEGFQTVLPELRAVMLGIEGVLVHKQNNNQTQTTQTNQTATSTPISTQLIRESFYDEMVGQTFEAMSNELITLEELTDQDVFIYFALPGLTLFAAIIKSLHCDGIKLQHNQVVNISNCPNQENFPILVKTLLQAKADIESHFGIKHFSSEEYRAIQSLLSNDPQFPENSPYKTERVIKCVGELKAIQYLSLTKRQELPEALKDYNTSRARQCAGLIKQMSLNISESKIFHQVIPTIIGICTGEVPEESTPSALSF